MPYTDTTVSNLIINVLTKEQYNSITPSNSELYLITNDDLVGGAGITLTETSGVTTIDHTNSITAQTTSALYPIKIDAQGHITEYGTGIAVPIPVESGGTGATSIANIQAGKDGAGNTITSKYVTLDTAQTISGTKTFSSEVKMTASGTSDICSGVLAAFKTNRAQITDFITHNIYTGGTNSTTPITFYKYTSVSGQAPGTKVQLAKIDTDGNIYEGTTKLSDKYLAKSGGTMTGALTLSGAPTSDLHAATKKYVDDNKYTHPTTSGNKHVPTGGSSGQFLGWSADGTAAWVANPNTNYYHKTGSWSGLTYTAAKVGSPDDLAFTIPTGTTSTTVAAGNHTHTTSLTSGGTATVNLAANTAYTLTAGGTTVVFKTPADGNTDTKVNVVSRGTTKTYLLGDTTAPTGTAAAHTAVAETGIYMTTTVGELNATQYKVNEAVTMQYNSTTKSLDFIFA